MCEVESTVIDEIEKKKKTLKFPLVNYFIDWRKYITIIYKKMSIIEWNMGSWLLKATITTMITTLFLHWLKL